MICDKIVSCTSTCRGTPKKSPKTCSEGGKTRRYSENQAKNYDFRQNLLLGINVSRYTETVPKNVPSGSKNLQVQPKPSNRLWLWQNLLIGISVSRYTEIVLKIGLSGSNNTQVHSYLWRSYRFYRYIYDTRASMCAITPSSSGLRDNAFYERSPR